MTERQIGLVTDTMILRHNDRETYFFNDISSVVDGFGFPSTYIYYYRLIFPCFLS